MANEGLSPTHRDPTHKKNGRQLPVAKLPAAPLLAVGTSGQQARHSPGQLSGRGDPSLPPTSEQEALRWAARPRTVDMGPALSSVSQFTEAALGECKIYLILRRLFLGGWALLDTEWFIIKP